MLRSLFSLAAIAAVTISGGIVSAAKPVFQSKLITSTTPGHAVEVDAEIKGAKKLYLVVTDGGNGYGCDWADWAEPRLVGDADMAQFQQRWERFVMGLEF